MAGSLYRLMMIRPCDPIPGTISRQINNNQCRLYLCCSFSLCPLRPFALKKPTAHTLSFNIFTLPYQRQILNWAMAKCDAKGLKFLLCTAPALALPLIDPWRAIGGLG